MRVEKKRVYKSSYLIHWTCWNFRYCWCIWFSVHGHVVWGICTKGAQLWQFTLMTYLKNWSHRKACGVIRILWAC